MPLKTVGKIKSKGEKYYFSSIQAGNAYWSSDSKIYLISVGLSGAQYDFWTVNGVIYFGQWELPHYIDKSQVVVIGEMYFGATIEKGGGAKHEGLFAE